MSSDAAGVAAGRCPGWCQVEAVNRVTTAGFGDSGGEMTLARWRRGTARVATTAARSSLVQTRYASGDVAHLVAQNGPFHWSLIAAGWATGGHAALVKEAEYEGVARRDQDRARSWRGRLAPASAGAPVRPPPANGVPGQAPSTAGSAPAPSARRDPDGGTSPRPVNATSGARRGALRQAWHLAPSDGWRRTDAASARA